MLAYRCDDEISLALPNLNSNRDAEAIVTAVLASQDELKRWLPWAAEISVEVERTVMQQTLEHFAAHSSLNLMIVYQGTIVGNISFNSFQAGGTKADVGYWLDSRMTGKVIMHRALATLCTIGFEEYGLNKIVIRAAVENDASNNVAQRAGFHHDGTLREGELLLDGVWHDENEWSLLRSEWQARQ